MIIFVCEGEKKTKYETDNGILIKYINQNSPELYRASKHSVVYINLNNIDNFTVVKKEAIDNLKQYIER